MRGDKIQKVYSSVFIPSLHSLDNDLCTYHPHNLRLKLPPAESQQRTHVSCARLQRRTLTVRMRARAPGCVLAEAA